MKRVYEIELPDSAKEVDGRSSAKQVDALYALYDALKAKGKDAVVISGTALGDYPGYMCTHYIASHMGVICLCVKTK